MKVLFICKDRSVAYPDAKYGLWNSANFIVTYLNSLNIPAALISVVDANSIDREITNRKPDLVILEALWVTPDKLKELIALHSSVKWVCRIHSKATFLANEGIALKWINEYSDLRTIEISCNNKKFNDDMREIGYDTRYLPNIYLPSYKRERIYNRSKVVHIGCFGSLRPMKNHLNQAISAIKFADDMNLFLDFHINFNRHEQNGDNVLKNLRALFAYQEKGHRLVEHSWMNHSDFLSLMARMDISMQCSLSESFNIVTADAISQDVPVVTSPEIEFVSSAFTANPVNSDQIVRAMKTAWYGRRIGLQYLNERALSNNTYAAKNVWKRFIETLV